MEVIKKTIHRALIMISTPCTGTTGMCNTIIPDLNVEYNIKLNLSSVVKDIGFFDSAEIEVVPETIYVIDDDGSRIIDDDNSEFIY